MAAMGGVGGGVGSIKARASWFEVEWQKYSKIRYKIESTNGDYFELYFF